MNNQNYVSRFTNLLQKIFNTKWLKVHYFVLNIDQRVVDELLRDFDLPVKVLDYQDFLLGDSIFFEERKLELYKRRFMDSTYRAYGVIENNMLAYSCWTSTQRMNLSIKGGDIILDKNEGYLEDDYCHPRFRKKGIHTKMVAYRVGVLHKLGKEKVIVNVADGNIPALRALEKNGFQEVGCFYIGKLLGRRFCTLKKNKRKLWP